MENNATHTTHLLYDHEGYAVHRIIEREHGILHVDLLPSVEQIVLRDGEPASLPRTEPHGRFLLDERLELGKLPRE